jgi:hypothetical protein
MTAPDHFDAFDRYGPLFPEPELTIERLNRRRVHVRRRRVFAGAVTAAFGVTVLAGALAVATASGPKTTEIAAGSATTTASTEPAVPPSTEPIADPVPPLPVEFTACVPTNSTFRTGVDEVITIPSPDGDVTLERRRGFTWRGAITSSDPRFAGTHFYSFDADDYTLPGGGEGPSIFAEGHRIETDEGAWQGSSYGGNIVLVGEGAYEGLTAIVSTESGGGCFYDFSGYVMEVPAPPVPYTGE